MRSHKTTLSIYYPSDTYKVTVKYVFIVLHADNEGEGGTFSCYSLLSRYANITHRDPREEPLVKLEDNFDILPPEGTPVELVVKVVSTNR